MVYFEGLDWYIRITDLLLPWSLSMIYRRIDTKIVTKLEPVCSKMTNPIEKSFKGRSEEYFCGVFRRLLNRFDDLRSHFKATEFRARTEFVKSSRDFGISLSKPGLQRLEGFASVSRVRGGSTGVLEVILSNLQKKIKIRLSNLNIP